MTKAGTKIASKTSPAKKAVAKSHKQAKESKTASAPKKAAKPQQNAVAPSIEAIPPNYDPSEARRQWATILRLIAQPQGATLADIMSSTGWRRHSVRGFISTASKTRGVESVKDEAGQRRYRLVD